MSRPKVVFEALLQADGSVTYSWQGHSIIASVNGPIEPQRRDELPDEAFLEVNVKQASGGGAPRDRHIEDLLHATFRHVILTPFHPGTLIQLTLQVLATPSASNDPFNGSVVPQSDNVIPVLPHLINASMFALLDGNIPLRKVCAAVGLSTVSGLQEEAKTLLDVNVENARSLHAFAYSNLGEMLLADSEGECERESWLECARMAKEACVGTSTPEQAGLVGFMREAVEAEVTKRTKWRGISQAAPQGVGI